MNTGTRTTDGGELSGLRELNMEELDIVAGGNIFTGLATSAAGFVNGAVHALVGAIVQVAKQAS
jgi:hypothetical protein